MIMTQKTDREILFKSDWPHIRRQLIWAFIVNLTLAIGIIAQMYFNQKLILYRLDQLEANQDALTAEIINLYRDGK